MDQDVTSTFADGDPFEEQLPQQRQAGGFERIPPQDLAAEQSVLGGMMLSKDAIGDVAEVLKPRDFYRPAHEMIFVAIMALYVQGEPVDPITVADELTKRGELAKAGGPTYVHTLVNLVPTAANAEYYAGIVKEKAVLRRLTEAGTRIAGMGYAAEGEVEEIATAAEKELLDAIDREEKTGYAYVSSDVESFFDRLEDRMKGGAKLTGVPTGLADLDALTGGLKAGQFIIIAARPAIGKSTLALDCLRSASIHHDYTSALFSLEMGRGEITDRLFSAECRVGHHHIQHGTVTEADWERIAAKAPQITEAPIIIDDSPNLTALEIRSRARRIKQKHGLGLLVVDYIQLMQSGGRRSENRQQEVSDMSRNLKLLAKELEVPVIALSQLNRGPEQRQDHKPMLSDLRESGSLEQDADIVILLHREDSYDKESPRAGEADLIVAKHRGGPTATITVAFQGHYSRFVDMTRD
ncbi:replicative DNA helicase [Kitasatospora aureofaciens]|nr:replicative DNA helicase [Kitasatospora aureofaciens]MBV6700283.1 replicative DNA helicase [Kitasatospora aureofaciens]